MVSWKFHHTTIKTMIEEDRQHLKWLYERLVNVHGENELYDYMHRFREIIDKPTEEESDGYHTFKELYEHRHALFLALLKSNPDKGWFSLRHSDGEFAFGGDWFIAGIELPVIGQISYHLPITMLKLARDTGALQLPVGKQWDGHSPQDVVNRLLSWVTTT